MPDFEKFRRKGPILALRLKKYPIVIYQLSTKLGTALLHECYGVLSFLSFLAGLLPDADSHRFPHKLLDVQYFWCLIRGEFLHVPQLPLEDASPR